MTIRPGAVVRVRVPRRFPGATGVVLAVSAQWVTVALGWRDRRTVPRRDVLAIVARVGPLRPGGEYMSTRLCAAFDRAPLDFGPSDGDGPDDGKSPMPLAG